MRCWGDSDEEGRVADGRQGHRDMIFGGDL